jgi:hypothetical protein
MHRTLNAARLNEYGVKLLTFSRVALAAIAFVVALSYAAPARSQTLNFTVETTTSGGTAVVPRLTWTTAPALAQCVASAVPAASDWTGPKGTQGTVLLAAINATRAYTLACTWPGNSSAVLRWTAPTTNVDGSVYNNPGGFRVQYGRTAANLDQSVYLQDPTVRTHTLNDLATGAWFFTVRAFNEQGLESAPAPTVTKTMSAGGQQSRTLEVVVRFPSPATGLTVE